MIAGGPQAPARLCSPCSFLVSNHFILYQKALLSRFRPKLFKPNVLKSLLLSDFNIHIQFSLYKKSVYNKIYYFCIHSSAFVMLQWEWLGTVAVTVIWLEFGLSGGGDINNDSPGHITNASWLVFISTLPLWPWRFYVAVVRSFNTLEASLSRRCQLV